MSFEFPVLIGDIGGTNARFALVRDETAQTHHFEPVRLADFPQIEPAIEATVLKPGGIRPATTLLAIATPLVGECFRLTNAEWTVDPNRMISAFGLNAVVLMNDFAAQGLAALALGREHLAPLGSGAVIDGQPKVVLGPGTGLGIAQIACIEGKWAIIPGEGGHIDLGPRTEREFTLWPYLFKLNGRMSAEEALSGRGIENLYSAVCAADGVPDNKPGAAGISAMALARTSAQAQEAVGLFVTLLARVAGDLALLTLARGGVYLSGGIAQKLLPGMDQRLFRAEFENKLPHRAIMASIAVNVMIHPTAALEGLAAWVRNPARFSVEGAARRFRAE